MSVPSPTSRLRVAVLALALLLPPAGAPVLAQSAPASFADLAERLSPAVVNISTSQTVARPQQRGPGPQLPPGSPFEDLFRDFFENGPGGPGGPGPRRGPQQVQSLGSGFVIDAGGYVVTNNHVIEDADEITVNFVDGTSLPAKLVGTDAKTDIALLKVESDEPLPAVEFGDSETARVGDWVIAIGNPFGLGGSVSAGIISARNRDINAGPYDDFIQTDAAINRGNSGGPLFDMDGDVIGVNTAIISPSGGSIGIGFSVPSNIVANVVGQLRDYGVTKRGWLGVRIQQVTDDLAEALGLDNTQGALVADVTAGGPAAAAGIEAGDVILQFDGKDIVTMRDLPRLVAETAVEKPVRVTVFRKGKTETLAVTVGLLAEDAAQLAAATPDDPGAPGAARTTRLDALGLGLGTLDDQARAQFGIPDSVTGVVVTDVVPQGPAAEKGVQPGDVIVEVGQEPVGSPAQVGEKVEAAVAAKRKSVLLLIQNGGDLRFVPLPLGG